MTIHRRIQGGNCVVTMSYDGDVLRRSHKDDWYWDKRTWKNTRTVTLVLSSQLLSRSGIRCSRVFIGRRATERWRSMFETPYSDKIERYRADTASVATTKIISRRSTPMKAYDLLPVKFRRVRWPWRRYPGVFTYTGWTFEDEEVKNRRKAPSHDLSSAVCRGRRPLQCLS